MDDNTESNRALTDDSTSLSVESLSDLSIRKELRSDAIQHPTTILPLSLCILSIIYLGFFPVAPGRILAAIVVIIGSGSIAIGSFLWHYLIRHDQAYRTKIQRIMELQDRVQREKEEADLKQFQQAIRSGLSKIDSTEGLKAMKELIHEYEQLQHVLDKKKETDPLSIAHIPALAKEAYRQGLSVLADVLEVVQVIHSSGRANLEAEIAKLEREIGLLKGEQNHQAQAKIKQATVVSHLERLEMIKQQELRVDKLLYQCDRCEASLHRTRIELAALKTESSERSVTAATDTLQRTINQAKEVQEELRKLGY